MWFIKLIFVIELIKFSSEFDCGEIKVATPLVFGGKPAEPGQWPWLVALYYKTNASDEKSYTFFCGATLINNRTLLSGEHLRFSSYFNIIQIVL